MRKLAHKRFIQVVTPLLACVAIGCADKTNAILESSNQELRRMNDNFVNQFEALGKQFQILNESFKTISEATGTAAAAANSFFSALSPESLQVFTESMQEMVEEIKYYRSEGSPIYAVMDASMLLFTMAARMEKALGTATEENFKAYTDYITRIATQMSELSQESPEQMNARLTQLQDLFKDDGNSQTIVSIIDGLKSEMSNFNQTILSASQNLQTFSGSLDKVDWNTLKSLNSSILGFTKKDGLGPKMLASLDRLNTYSKDLLGAAGNNKDGVAGDILKEVKMMNLQTYCHSKILSLLKLSVRKMDTSKLPKICQNILNNGINSTY